ncbi:GNAT family N-acetyltransferase [Streptomyces sp. WMMC500]|uniref:GNAT family N-acetyltransferase n=1 Tax=Streptomyces sp. WMMC500 TaxID=3015154 RepID=UPI00248B7785|nr:GNAT family N-acetyltransferase [Streptomyces sp. WMMC500]WBB62325.1 GNAT family N-acetyltransferase [Streptomyces sp. WMMC500]
MPLTVRAARLDDAPSICALLNQVDVAEVGRPETDLHTVEADLKHPEADLPRNSWLAVADDGTLVAYGLLWDESYAERIDVDHYVLPGHQDAGLRLLERMEARAAAKAAENGVREAVVHLQLRAAPTMDTALLDARGWHVVRRYHVLTRDVAPAADPAPVPPPGVRLRDCTAEPDRRIAHDLLQQAMAEHFDFQPKSYETWLADPANADVDWSLVWIAHVDGLGDAGALLARNDREAMGWIPTLGVLADARGRGLGGLLLRHAFAAFAGRGREVVGLGVDTANDSGAVALYERHGMVVYFAVDTWEITLPARG